MSERLKDSHGLEPIKSAGRRANAGRLPMAAALVDGDHRLLRANKALRRMLENAAPWSAPTCRGC